MAMVMAICTGNVFVWSTARMKLRDNHDQPTQLHHIAAATNRRTSLSYTLLLLSRHSPNNNITMLPGMASNRDTGDDGGDELKNNPLLQESTLLSPLEQEVLDEYSTLLENMNKVRFILFDFSFIIHGLACQNKTTDKRQWRLCSRTHPPAGTRASIPPWIEQLSDLLADLSSRPVTQTLDGLRLLERKTATVCTLLKASVYSIVLQQQIYNEAEGGGGDTTSESTTARREGHGDDGDNVGGESMEVDDENESSARY